MAEALPRGNTLYPGPWWLLLAMLAGTKMARSVRDPTNIDPTGGDVECHTQAHNTQWASYWLRRNLESHQVTRGGLLLCPGMPVPTSTCIVLLLDLPSHDSACFLFTLALHGLVLLPGGFQAINEIAQSLLLTLTQDK